MRSLRIKALVNEGGADISGSLVCFCHQSLVGAGLGSWLVGLGVGGSVAFLAKRWLVGLGVRGSVSSSGALGLLGVGDFSPWM